MITFSQFYKDNYLPTVHYVSQKLGSRAEAEDFTQNVFMKMFSNWKNIDPKISTHRTYLFRCVKNALVDKHTTKNRKNIFFASVQEDHKEEQYGFVPQANTDNGYAQMVMKEYVEKFRNELHRLPVNQKRVANLYFNHGFKYQEIADRTSLPMGSVCCYVSKIKKQFQHAF